MTYVGLALNLILSALKGILGYAAGSQACIADAVHSVSDCITDLAVLVGVEFWMAPADQGHPHGHQRIETLVTVFIGTVLAVAAVGMGWKAVHSIGEPHSGPPGWAAFVAAIVSIITKEWLYRWTAQAGAALHSPSLTANAWHHRSDALSSIPVALAVLIARIWPSVLYADHIAAVLVTGMLFHAAWRISWPSLQELTDRGADAAAQAAMLDLVRTIEGVEDVRALRSRRLGPGYAVDLSVLVDPSMSVRKGHDICERVRDALATKGGPLVIDVLVHLEPFEGDAATGQRFVQNRQKKP